MHDLVNYGNKLISMHFKYKEGYVIIAKGSATLLMATIH